MGDMSKGNTKFVHTDRALIKVVDHNDSIKRSRGDKVTVKICPRLDVQYDQMDGRTVDVGPEYDEVTGAISTELDWTEVNILIDVLRQMRDRVFGKPA